MQKEQKKTKKEVNEKTIRTCNTFCTRSKEVLFSIHAVNINVHVDIMKTSYLVLHSGDEGMTLTGAPCMPMSPGLPGNPG